MTKEELIELKKKIASLSDEEKKKRDLYLRKIALGEIDGPMTGYASIDEPWTKYYKTVETLDNNKTIYQEIRDNNKDNLNALAIEFFGTKINYKALIKNIDKTAQSFKTLGIQNGDYITICSAGIPEIIYSLYAVSKTGAVANCMSPYFDANQMAERINECNSKVLIVMDKFYPLIRKAIKNSTIEKVIIVPTLNSSILKLLPSKDRVKPMNEKEILWDDFIRNRDKSIVVKEEPYEEKKPLCMVYSSGTTGASKAILLSNDSFQNSVHAYPITGLNVTKGQKFYQVIPPWYSTGLSTSIHLPLTCSASIFMDPRFDREVFVKNILKKGFDAIVAPTGLYEGFQNEELLKGKKIRGLSNAFQGGERFEDEKKKAIEKILKEHGCNYGIKIGYGECECGAGITTQTDEVCDTPDTVGIPLYGVKVGIFDEDRNELPYNQRGEILVNTPCGMLEYFNNKAATDAFFYTDEAGTKWSCTGDVGYMNTNGELTVEGRKSDSFTINGELIYNFDIESVISKFADIINNDVIFVDKPNNSFLVANIVLNEKLKQLYNNNPKLVKEKFIEIQKAIYEKYKDENMIPEYFKVWDSFPIALSGKRDVELMKKESEDSMFVDKSLILKNGTV